MEAQRAQGHLSTAVVTMREELSGVKKTRLRPPLLLALFAVLCLQLSAQAAEHYVSPNGSDGNSGTSPSRPWKTIAKVDSWDFKPGDRILFQGGQAFVGNLLFTAADAGTSTQPVTVSTYGTGRATILAGDGTGILVESAGGFSISNLVVIGENRTTNKGNGVCVLNRLPGAVKLGFVRIDNVDSSHFGGSGILVGGDPPDSSKSGFDDVRITRCKVHGNAYYGIHVTGAWNPSASGYANRRVYVGHCKAYDNPGDPAFQKNHSGNGIMIEEVDVGVIERCVAYNNGYLCNYPGGGPTGIWAHAANKVIIQYNESYNNRTGRSVDGGGFDFDGGVSNSLLQYNYSHGNDGAGYLLYVYKGAPLRFRNNVIRYNISEDDGRKNTYSGIYVGNDGSGVSELEIFNNTIYISPSTGAAKPRAVLVRGTTNVHFRNNIFVTTGGVPLLDVAEKQPGLLFQGNNYWAGEKVKPAILWAGETYDSLDAWRSATRQETIGGRKTGLSMDPQFSDSGRAVTVGNPDLLSTLAAYRLKPSSSLIRAGLDLRQLFKLDPGLTDFFGSDLSRIPSIGADDSP
jgi:hypothetical protein